MPLLTPFNSETNFASSPEFYKLRVPIPFEVKAGQKFYKRSDHWRLRYRVQRYLSYLSMEELDKRNVDIFTNLTTLTPKGQLGLPPITRDEKTSWMERWTHIMEEYGLRGTGMRAGFIRDVQMPKPTAPKPAKGSQELLNRGIDATGKLVKYGNKAWLEETWKTGRWRIAPASYYSSNELCDARKDSEMELSICIPEFVRHPNATGKLDDEFPDSIASVRTMHVRAKTDYYMACLSRTFVHRLFDDFDSDSCLIVLDEEKFKSRMIKAFADFRPRWHRLAEAVEYVDPVLPTKTPNVYLAKHFRFSYQEEFRFALIPRPFVSKLQPAYLELGSLVDCCAFVSVN